MDHSVSDWMSLFIGKMSGVPNIIGELKSVYCGIDYELIPQLIYIGVKVVYYKK